MNRVSHSQNLLFLSSEEIIVKMFLSFVRILQSVYRWIMETRLLNSSLKPLKYIINSRWLMLGASEFSVYFLGQIKRQKVDQPGNFRVSLSFLRKHFAVRASQKGVVDAFK